MRQASRRTLDDKFSEGARLLWIAVAAHGWNQAAAAKAIGMPSGQLSKFLYGVRKPGREWATKLHEKLLIPLATWDMPSTIAFEPPAARPVVDSKKGPPKKARARRRTPTIRPAKAA
jgi:hypothetical protein